MGDGEKRDGARPWKKKGSEGGYEGKKEMSTVFEG